MKKLLLAGFAVSALIAPAIAADMPVPAAPVATWTGFYVGANAGYALSAKSSMNSVGLPNNCNDFGVFGCIPVPGFGVLNPYGQASAQAATFSTPSSRQGGALYGGQFGYNYQLGTSSVIGLEADLQGTSSKHSTTFGSVTPVAGFPANPIAQTATVGTKLDFLGTIRARAGYLWTPEFLLYITAGLAYGETEVSSSITQSIVGASPLFFTPYTAAGSNSTVRFGGTIGAGLEWMLVRNWSVRAEYLYVGLDSRGAASLNTTLINSDHAGTGNLSSVAVLTSARFNENIARGAVNYHF